MWTQTTHADNQPVMLEGRDRWPVATLRQPEEYKGERIQIVPFQGEWVAVSIHPGRNPVRLEGASITPEIQASIDWAYKFMEDIGGAPTEASMTVEQLIGDNV